ncbi:MAG: zinc ribbon domain-containing protein [Oscillospiraceae bacterium]|nr:zinc ribbon domain-containing protein [Oscillospiraceae bacterium]
MERKCPNCGKKLPEEASFCLYCFSDINDFKKTEVPIAVKSNKKIPKPTPALITLKTKFNKRLLRRIGYVAAFLLIMGICVFAMRSVNLNSSLKAEADTTIIKETSAVAVTNEAGESVTDENGEQVFDIVEVTKIAQVTTTEKQGFFDKIFNSTSKKNQGNEDKNGDSDSTSTTKRQSFFDKLFGKDEEDTTSNSSTTQKNDTTTEEYGTTENSSASSSTTTQPTATKPSQTETQTSEIYETNTGSYYFEYRAANPSYPDGNIALTKYVGDASVVTIPSYIDGRKVSEIYTDCFINEPKIKEINCDDSTTYILIFSYHCFNNLTSLNRVVLNGRSMHISPCFAINCPITYLGKGGEAGNKLVDGAYYVNNAFYWFTAHPSYTTLTFPEWCTKIDNGHNLDEVSNLQVMNIHKNVKNIPTSPLHYGDGLKAINVENGNPEAFSSEGVLFYRWGANDYLQSLYPYQKTSKSFKVPNNCCLHSGKSTQKTVNTYLEELYLPATAFLSSPDADGFYKNCFPNLKKIHLSKNHPQYDEIAKTFKGELIVEDI